MSNAFHKLLFAAILLTPPSTGALSQEAGKADAFAGIQELMIRQITEAAPQARAPVANRTGEFVVKIDITTKYNIVPQSCSVSFSHLNNYDSGGALTTGTAPDFKCTVKVPYLWRAADDAQKISVSISTSGSTSGNQKNRYSSHSLQIDLPAQGATTTINYDLKL